MNIHEMTDDQLCEAISEAREPKPPEMTGSNFSKTKAGNWKYTPEFFGIYEIGWHPIDWLSWENTGKLLEEMSVTLYCPNSAYADAEYSNGDDYVVEIGRNSRAESDRPQRALCEAWLILNEVKKS
jgi:hypothetical protein